jgi:hypothetical protein
LLIVGVAIGTLARGISDPLRVLAELLLLGILMWAGWTAVTR